MEVYAMPARDVAEYAAKAHSAELAKLMKTAPSAVNEAYFLQETAVPTEILAQTLLTYGYKVTDENKAMLRLMLENGMPLTEENIRKMNQALKLAQSPERALFMLQNNIRMTQANAALLEGFAAGQTKIATQLGAVLAAADALGDPALATKVKQILAQMPGETAAQPAQPPAQNLQTAQQPAQQAQPAPVVAQPASAAQPQTAPEIPAPQPAAPVPSAPPAQALQPTVQTANPTSEAQPRPAPQAASQPPSQTAQSLTPQPATQPTARPATQPTQPQTIPPLAPEAQTATQPTAQTVPSATPQAAIPQAAPAPAPPLPQSLLFPLENSSPQAVEQYFTNLREILTQITQELAGRESPDATRVLQEVRTLEAQIDFASQIRNQIFVQLPLFHDGRQTHLNLHVYKDAKKSGGGGESSSALIALDTANLGHFETYVRKNSHAVQCQFRLESDEIAALVRENIHTLDALLRDRGYSLEHFSFRPPGEPYTVLDNLSDPPEHRGDEMSHFDKKV